MTLFKPRQKEPRISIPHLPADATREQIMEFAAVMGALSAHLGPRYREHCRRIVVAYLERWHPEDEALTPIREETPRAAPSDAELRET